MALAKPPQDWLLGNAQEGLDVSGPHPAIAVEATVVSQEP